MTMFPQVGRVPGEIEIGAKKETAITERDVPHIRRAQDPLPWRRLPRRDQRLDAAIRVEPSYLRQFCLIDALVLLGPVPVVPSENDGPDHAQQSENVKDRPPAEGQHD